MGQEPEKYGYNNSPSGQTSQGCPPSYEVIQVNGPNTGMTPMSSSSPHSFPVPGRMIPNGNQPTAQVLPPVTYSYEDTRSQTLLLSQPRRGWKDYNSHEKMLYYVLGFVAVLTCIFVGISIHVAIKLNEPEEIVYPTRPPVTTLLPPWLTTTSTVPTTTTRTTTTQHPAVNTCLDPECARAAGRMMDMMSEAIDPCDDFYEYACGGFLEDDIPDSESLWDQFAISEQALAKEIQKLLENDTTDIPMPVTQAKQIYASCINLGSPDYVELKEQIDEWLGKDEDELAESLANLRKYLGADYIFKTYVDLDEGNNEANVIYIDQPDFGLARPFLSDPSHRFYEAYKTLVEEAYNEVYSTGGAEAAEAVLNVETALEQISTIPEYRRNLTELYNPTTVEELYELSEIDSEDSKLKWEIFFEKLFQDISELDTDPLELRVVVRDLEYFGSLNTVLNELKAEELKMYLQWRIIQKLAMDVSMELHQIFFKYQKVTQGLRSSPRPWRVCSERTNALMGPAVAYAYLQEHPIEESKAKVEYMLSILKDAFIYLIRFGGETGEGAYGWISPETLVRVEEKLGNLTVQLAYPEYLQNPTEENDITEYYGNLTLENPENLLQNVLDVYKWESILGLQNFTDPEVNVGRWRHDPLVANAFYSAVSNTITIPAGILRLPWFGYPVEYLNMATLGTIIGREIIHAFDDIGLQYDPLGNLKEWWDEESLNNFTELATCFVDQYSKYEVPELDIAVNGTNTLTENIADNGGFSLARTAHTLNYYGEKVLPGFDANGFTEDKLYYLAYAQSFCGAYTSQQMESTVKVDTHSPDPFRVRGVLENSAEFRAVWNCPAPAEEQICKIW